MEQLLCHPPESTTSRHRVGMHAEAVFKDLEEWMSAGTHWQQALSHWKSKPGTEKLLGTAANKKKMVWKAPGLHSPSGMPVPARRGRRGPGTNCLAGMLALLVLEHPAKGMKEWIGRLQIRWMMTQNRSVLNVREGFWRGITTSNLHSVFAPPESYESNLPHQADYSKLFGEDFPRCRRDIRPFVPSWAQNIRLTEDMSDDEEDGAAEGSPAEDGRPLSDAHESTPAEISSQEASETREAGTVDPRPQISTLRAQLTPSASVEPRVLFLWLMDKLGVEEEQVENRSTSVDEETTCWSAWCEHWEERLDHVMTLLEQRVTMELFMQSLRRLHSLDAASLSTVYMRVDVEEEELMWQDVARHETAKRKLRHSTEGAAYFDASSRLAALVEDSGGQIASPLLNRLLESYTCFFATLSPDLLPEVVRFETTRTEILLQDLEGLRASGDLQLWRKNMDVLMDKRAMTALKLTKSQLRQLLLPGASYQDHLTTSQAKCFRNKLDRGTLTDDSNKSPLTITIPDGLVDDMSPQSLAAQHKHPTLRKYFGILVSVNGEEQAGTARPAGTTQTPVQASMQAPPPPTPTSVRSMRGQSRSVTRSPGPRPASKASKAHLVTPATTLDDFLGSRRAPAKRGASPQVGRQAKMPRLSLQEELRAEFRAELEAERQQWRSELAAERAQVSKMNSELQKSTNRSCDELKQAMEAVKTECVRELNTTADATKADIMESLSNLQTELETRVHSRVDDLHISLKADLSADIQAALQSNAEQASTLFQTVLETHLITEKVPIKPGQDGYLGEHCSAPADWSGTQSQYEGQLERAAWVYILQLDESEAGVDADETAIKDTLAQFPELVDEHIITALNHVHQRVYHGPIRRLTEGDGA